MRPPGPSAPWSDPTESASHSGHDGECFLRRCGKSREARMNGHISKPIDLAEVYRTLSAALGGGM